MGRFFFINEKTIRPEQNKNTQNSYAYARITGVLSFLLSQVSHFHNNNLINTTLEPHLVHISKIKVFKCSHFIPNIIERCPFQYFILRLSPPFFGTRVTLVTAKNQNLCKAHAHTHTRESSTDFIPNLICAHSSSRIKTSICNIQITP